MSNLSLSRGHNPQLYDARKKGNKTQISLHLPVASSIRCMLCRRPKKHRSGLKRQNGIPNKSPDAGTACKRRTSSRNHRIRSIVMLIVRFFDRRREPKTLSFCRKYVCCLVTGGFVHPPTACSSFLPHQRLRCSHLTTIADERVLCRLQFARAAGICLICFASSFCLTALREGRGLGTVA